MQSIFARISGHCNAVQLLYIALHWAFALRPIESLLKSILRPCRGRHKDRECVLAWMRDRVRRFERRLLSVRTAPPSSTRD